MERIAAEIQGLASNYLYWVNIPHVGILDIVEMLIIAILIYGIIVWVRSTRAWTLFMGLVAVGAAVIVANFLGMDIIVWIAQKTMSVGVIALIILFQPELRNALEQVGSTTLGGHSSFMKRLMGREGDEILTEKSCDEIVDACYKMAEKKTGALIVIEKNVGVGDFERNGIAMDSVISSALILNIFEKNTPLHDGAVIIRNDRIVAATCYLPLSDSTKIPKEYGTRHRAALGVSGVSDSLTIVVSEETGKVSIAFMGELKSGIERAVLRDELIRLANHDEPEDEERQHKVRRWLNERN